MNRKCPEAHEKPRAEGEAPFHSWQCPSWGSARIYQGGCQNKYDTFGTGSACPLWASCSSLRLDPHNAGFFPDPSTLIDRTRVRPGSCGCFPTRPRSVLPAAQHIAKNLQFKQRLGLSCLSNDGALILWEFWANRRNPDATTLSVGVLVHCPPPPPGTHPCTIYTPGRKAPSPRISKPTAGAPLPHGVDPPPAPGYSRPWPPQTLYKPGPAFPSFTPALRSQQKYLTPRMEKTKTNT